MKFGKVIIFFSKWKIKSINKLELHFMKDIAITSLMHFKLEKFMNFITFKLKRELTIVIIASINFI